MRTPYLLLAVLTVFLTASLGTFTPAFAQSGPVRGKLTFISGEVQIKRDASVFKAEAGQELFDGDVIVTRGKAQAVVTLNEGPVLKLNANSELAIEQGEEIIFPYLRTGSAFTQVPKRQNRPPFKLRTRSAILGVRGTRFFTGIHQEDTWIGVLEGELSVTNALSKTGIPIQGGQGLRIGMNRKIPAPKLATWLKKLNWNLDPAAGDLTNPEWVDLAEKEFPSQK